MISEQRELIKNTLVEKKGYAYICGDAKNMARDVEELLKEILAEAKGGTKHKEGEAECKQRYPSRSVTQLTKVFSLDKMLKERNRLLLDVWS